MRVVQACLPMRNLERWLKSQHHRLRSAVRIFLYCVGGNLAECRQSDLYFEL